jgi:SRSO17 transposase
VVNQPANKYSRRNQNPTAARRNRSAFDSSAIHSRNVANRAWRVKPFFTFAQISSAKALHPFLFLFLQGD